MDEFADWSEASADGIASDLAMGDDADYRGPGLGADPPYMEVGNPRNPRFNEIAYLVSNVMFGSVKQDRGGVAG
jgi:hypothetical protein